MEEFLEAVLSVQTALRLCNENQSEMAVGSAVCDWLWQISDVSSLNQATPSEDIINWENLVFAVAICRVCKLVRVLQLFVVWVMTVQ
jgi:hypothetical protein